ncbi:hypothetical protein FHW89_001039 [Mucilaginibacter sp. SG564]|nr:hypothetical protein [Mucilaginibacter sp. SG564]
MTQLEKNQEIKSQESGKMYSINAHELCISFLS